MKRVQPSPAQPGMRARARAGKAGRGKAGQVHCTGYISLAVSWIRVLIRKGLGINCLIHWGSVAVHVATLADTTIRHDEAQWYYSDQNKSQAYKNLLKYLSLPPVQR